jgi:hypothetical protein
LARVQAISPCARFWSTKDCTQKLAQPADGEVSSIHTIEYEEEEDNEEGFVNMAEGEYECRGD